MAAKETVRVATAEDAAEVWRLFLQGHRENGLFKSSPDKVRWLLQRILAPEHIHPMDTGPRGVIGVIGPVGGELAGLAFILICSTWYTDEKYLEELIVYVDPEKRSSTNGQVLLDWMKEQVEKTKLPLLSGIISNHRTEAKCRMYRRNLPKVGEFFFLAPKGEAASVMASS